MLDVYGFYARVGRKHGALSTGPTCLLCPTGRCPDLARVHVQIEFLVFDTWMEGLNPCPFASRQGLGGGGLNPGPFASREGLGGLNPCPVVSREGLGGGGA